MHNIKDRKQLKNNYNFSIEKGKKKMAKTKIEEINRNIYDINSK